MLDELVQFAKERHKGFAGVDDERIRAFFENFKDTTLVTIEDNRIVGFAVYIDRPEGLYFFCMAGSGNKVQNLARIFSGMKKLPEDKLILWHDEKMRLHKCRCH